MHQYLSSIAPYCDLLQTLDCYKQMDYIHLIWVHHQVEALFSHIISDFLLKCLKINWEEYENVLKKNIPMMPAKEIPAPPPPTIITSKCSLLPVDCFELKCLVVQSEASKRFGRCTKRFIELYILFVLFK